MASHPEAISELTRSYQHVAALYDEGGWEIDCVDPSVGWALVHNVVSHSLQRRRSGMEFQAEPVGMAELVQDVGDSSSVGVRVGWSGAACMEAEVTLAATLERLRNERPCEINRPPMAIVLDKSGQPVGIQKSEGTPSIYTFKEGWLRTSTGDIRVPENAFLMPNWDGKEHLKPHHVYRGRVKEHAVILDSKQLWPTGVDFMRFSTAVFSPLVWKALFDYKNNPLLARQPITPEFVEAQVQQLIDDGDVQRV